jgi:hypothetical protein
LHPGHIRGGRNSKDMAICGPSAHGNALSKTVN